MIGDGGLRMIVSALAHDEGRLHETARFSRARRVEYRHVAIRRAGAAEPTDEGGGERPPRKPSSLLSGPSVISLSAWKSRPRRPAASVSRSRGHLRAGAR